jgi:hypothetical protein
VDWKVKLSNSSKEPGWLLLVGLEKRVMRHRLAAPLGLKEEVLSPAVLPIALLPAVPHTTVDKIWFKV